MSSKKISIWIGLQDKQIMMRLAEKDYNTGEETNRVELKTKICDETKLLDSLHPAIIGQIDATGQIRLDEEAMTADITGSLSDLAIASFEKAISIKRDNLNDDLTNFQFTIDFENEHGSMSIETYLGGPVKFKIKNSIDPLISMDLGFEENRAVATIMDDYEIHAFPKHASEITPLIESVLLASVELRDEFLDDSAQEQIHLRGRSLLSRKHFQPLVAS